jgi:hypothetical protein
MKSLYSARIKMGVEINQAEIMFQAYAKDNIIQLFICILANKILASKAKNGTNMIW